MSLYVGEFEPGQLIPITFNTRLGSGTPTDQVRKVGGGIPEFEIVRHSDDLTIPLTGLEINKRPGWHKGTIDTGDPSVASFFQKFDNYSLLAKDVEVNDGSGWVSVVNEEVKSLPIIFRTAGFVLDRSHKIFDGKVSSVTDGKVFRITGTGIDLSTPDYYRGKQLAFQPPSENQGIDLVIADSRVVGQEVEVTMQLPYPKVPAVNDPFDMLHHLPESVFTANIVFDAAKGARTDRATVRWQRDREEIADIDVKIPNMTMQVYLLQQNTAPQSQVPVLRETLQATPSPVDGAYHFAMTGSTQVGEGLHMKCSALYVPTNRTVTDSRTMYVN